LDRFIFICSYIFSPKTQLRLTHCTKKETTKAKKQRREKGREEQVYKRCSDQTSHLTTNTDLTEINPPSYIIS